MQPKNLRWKFAGLALLVALSIYCIWAKELRQGTDLKGGHILTFEVQLDKTSDPQVVQQVINTLKERIDPSGLGNVTITPVGKNRFEVRMPMGTEVARKAKLAYDQALEQLQEGNVRRSDLRRIESAGDDERAKLIQALSTGDADRADALNKVVKCFHDLTAAQQRLDELRRQGDVSAELTKQTEAYQRARYAYYEAQQAILQSNIEPQKLRDLLELYVSRREEDRLPAKEVEERTKALTEGLAALRDKYPDRQQQIDAVAKAGKIWTEKRTGLDDPADLKRIVAKAGVLEFRIAPIMSLPGEQRELALAQDQRSRYLKQLMNEGPMAGHARNDEFAWFPLRKGGERLSPSIIVGKYAAKKFVLLYNKADFMMLQRVGEGGRRPWSLEATATVDQMGRNIISFNLNTRGAGLMLELTTAHKGHFMAILLDDEVYSAPVIKSEIYDRGQITGNFTAAEAMELQRTLNAGALWARVNPNPVSEKTIAASIGKDNLEAGIRAAMWGLIAVAAFMALYYLAAGMIANFALVLNLVLVLGAMSFIEGVFTLPGIAGVILTIGMAVDANVLIFERLREEQAKTQSMRMAIRNAYSNAATAILDGNATTLITCMILGWVGTVEVRGFATTLGLGVMFSLFTALIVTRWIFQLLAEAGVVTKQVRMLAFIGIPKINWMAKRRIFWTFSILLAVFGIVSLSYQGREILGLKFSSGTQASFSFKRGQLVPDENGRDILPQRGQIQAALKAQARRLAEQSRSAAAASQPAGDDATHPAGADHAGRARLLTKLAETAKVETIIQPGKAHEWMAEFGKRAGQTITLSEFVGKKYSQKIFAELDSDEDGKLTRAELENLPEWSYQVSTTISAADSDTESAVDLLREVIRGAFSESLAQTTAVDFQRQTAGRVPRLNIDLDEALEGEKKDTPTGWTHISEDLVEQKLSPVLRDTFRDFVGGAMFVINNVKPALTEDQLADRIKLMRGMPDFADYRYNRTAVIGLQAAANTEGFSSFAVLAHNPSADYFARQQEWDNFAQSERELLEAALKREQSLESLSSFDPAIAKRAFTQAIIAFVLSWAAIIVYLWLRFGSLRWGCAAVVCLVHDVVIAVGLVGASAYLAKTALGQALLITPFKIDMAMVAAFLTIIGYSVNDTIVVFDRIRENRGKLASVDERTINRSINQTISRTLLTTTTTLIAVVVMYVWGGVGIHAFTFALLVGIIFGTYSSIAIASPLLLGFKHALIGRAVGPAADK